MKFRKRIVRSRKLDMKFQGQKLKGYEDTLTGSKFWTAKGYFSKEFRDGIIDILNEPTTREPR